MDEILHQLRVRAEIRIREGFDSRANIIDGVIESLEDEHAVTIDRRDAARIVDEELLAHSERQSTWTEPTDCDKLDAAFAEMEKRGLVARQHFSCCSNCGHSDMRDAVAAALALRPVTGYAFYHMQDTERAADGGSIFIKFGTVGDTTDEEVGRHIADAVAASGLGVKWDGSADSAVEIGITDWRKRRANEHPLAVEG